MNCQTSSAAPAEDVGPLPRLAWREQREWFRSHLRQRSLAPVHSLQSVHTGISTDEIDAHFSGMPAHYWERVTEGDLVWGLETIHGFLKLIASPNAPATAPFVSWRQFPELGHTRLMLCTWDRRGLLAKAAAALSAVRLNLLRANVFTRGDSVVLDEFCVTNANGRGAVNETRLQEMKFLLDGALSEPPRFASVWACSRHKFLAAPTPLAPCITFDNDTSPAHTLVRIEAADRLGLLYDILQALADSELNVTQARIETDDDLARDTIHVIDECGQKMLDPRRLKTLRASLEAAITVSE